MTNFIRWLGLALLWLCTLAHGAGVTTGSITTVNLAATGDCTASSCVPMDIRSAGAVQVGVANTYTATGGLVAQLTLDGKVWTTLAGATTFTKVSDNTPSATIASGATGQYQVSGIITGARAIRIVPAGTVTGQADITIAWAEPAIGSSSAGGGGGTADSTAANQATQITAEQAIQATVGATTSAAIGDVDGTINGHARNTSKYSILIQSDTSRITSSTGGKADTAPLATTALQIGCTYRAAGITLVDTHEAGCSYDGSGSIRMAPTYGGVAASTGNGVSGTGTLRVTIASDSTGTVNLGTIGTAATAANQTSTNTKLDTLHTDITAPNTDLTNTQTSVAPGAATATKGVLGAGQYNSTPPTFANGQQGSTQFDVNGNTNVNVKASALPPGAATSANQVPGSATAAADTTRVPVSQPDVKCTTGTATGNVVMTGSPYTFPMDTTGYESISAQVTVAGTGTVNYEQSNDNSTFALTNGFVSTNTGSAGSVNTTTATGLWKFQVFGQYFQPRVSSYAAGTITAVICLRKSPMQATIGANVQNTLSANILQMPGWSFGHMTTATTTTQKSGAGVAHNICINTGAAGSATVFDNTAGSGTVIAVIDTAAKGCQQIDASFATGLTITTSATPDLTVTYR